MLITRTSPDESANAYQAHNDPVDPGSDDGEEAPDYDDDEENETLSSYIALDDVTIYGAAELDAIALLADAWNDDLDPEEQVRNWYKRAHKLTFLSERTKEKGNVKTKERQGQISCSTVASVVGEPSTTRERTKGEDRVSSLRSNGTLGKRPRAQCLPPVRLNSNTYSSVWPHDSSLQTERIKLERVLFLTNRAMILIHPHMWLDNTYLFREKRPSRYP